MIDQCVRELAAWSALRERVVGTGHQDETRVAETNCLAERTLGKHRQQFVPGIGRRKEIREMASGPSRPIEIAGHARTLRMVRHLARFNCRDGDGDTTPREASPREPQSTDDSRTTSAAQQFPPFAQIAHGVAIVVVVGDLANARIVERHPALPVKRQRVDRDAFDQLRIRQLYRALMGRVSARTQADQDETARSEAAIQVGDTIRLTASNSSLGWLLSAKVTTQDCVEGFRTVWEMFAGRICPLNWDSARREDGIQTRQFRDRRSAQPYAASFGFNSAPLGQGKACPAIQHRRNSRCSATVTGCTSGPV